MKLETDIRTWLPKFRQGSVASGSWWEKLASNPAAPTPKFSASTWVKLFNPPTAFSFDEAWLLCECSEEKWLAWIPDYGEILLNTNEFCAT
ncbi:MAG: hypothetical protein EAZ09_11455 [Oscillatoriales cyanobacterium]|nr:MAG: hypothetical protein EAZ18_09680 [Oscillatoriales cyanobacterium]TAH21886.1 MAG: hypothetical protein EAZ09_11455 [Oscillatoriales cyanobacterium]